MPKGIKGFQKGHKIYIGSEQGWFKKGQFLGQKHPLWKGGKTIVSECKQCSNKKIDYVKRDFCSKLCRANWVGENILKGKICSEVTKKKIGIANKIAWQNSGKVIAFRPCKFCKVIFKNKKQPRSIYCSIRCFYKNNKKDNHSNWRGGIPKCINCGIEKKWYVGLRCRKCADLVRPKRQKVLPVVSRICITCGNQFNLKYNQVKKENWGKYCSRKCRGKTMTKENNWSWKGGITPLYYQIRHSDKYKNWVKENMKRDIFTCRDCGKKGGILHVDHIKPFALILVENSIETFEQAMNCLELWDVNNGQTLCENCHKKTDTYGYKTVNLLKNYGYNTNN